jgi:receptor protein-tyrosine kinase
MSLIERAGKRLEALRRTGSEIGGDLSGLVSDQIDASRDSQPNTIERAVTYAGARKARTQFPEVRSFAPAPGDAATRSTTAAELTQRREPRISDWQMPEHRVSDAPRAVELDFSSLAARGYLTPDDPEGPLANQFRKVKWPLVQACQGKTSPRVENASRIMITSSVPGEGKSFVALNLALSIAAERDHSVLLVDADTTRPSLSRLLGISSELGLLDLLSGKAERVEGAVLQTNVERLSLLPAGERRAHATELLASEAMARLVQQLSMDYPDRILIFDGPPLLAAPEPAVLASYMGQIILVAEADRTTHATLRSALALVESCPVVRMILNKANSRSERYSYAG